MTLCSGHFTDTLAKKKRSLSSEYQTGSTKKTLAGKQDGKQIKEHQRVKKQLVVLFCLQRAISFWQVGKKLTREL